MKLTFDNFSKGLVSADALAKLSEDYTQKCSELQNMYIHRDDTLRRRPPITTPDSPLSEIKNIQDMQVSEQKQYVLTNVVPSELPDLPEELQSILKIEDLLGDEVDLAALYQRSGNELVASTTAELDTGIAQVNLRAVIQRIRVFNVVTREEILDEGYTLAAVKHDITIEYQGRQVSLSARRAQQGGVLPANYDIDDVEEPAVVMIFGGVDANAPLLGSAHTVSFKSNEQSTPSVIDPNIEDARTEFSPILIASPTGQREFINTRIDQILRPLDDLDVHPLGGVAFLFAGLFYRINGADLQCENGPTLFPDVATTDFDSLATFVEDNVVTDRADLPMRVLYVPAKDEPEAGQSSIYTQQNLKTALGAEIIKEVGQDGFNQVAGIEKLLADKRIRGFEYSIFQQLFPTLHPVLKNIKKVVGFYQDPSSSAAYMYPDVKHLIPDSDINGAGSVYPLYLRDANNRAAIVMPSVPRLNVASPEPSATDPFPLPFKTQPVSTEFENGGGLAAGGIGVTIALYSNLATSRNADTGAVETSDTSTQVPTGFLYFYLDYSDTEVASFFDNVDILSGFCSAGDRFHSAIMRKAATTKTRPALAFEDILATNMSTVAADGSDSHTFYSARDIVATTERLLNFPFGPTFSAVRNFGTPCYYVSETPGSGAAAHSWELGDNLASDITGDNRSFSISQSMLRYLVLPTTYRANTGRLHVLQGRSAISSGNQVHFSQVGELSKFSNPLARFWSSFTTASRSYKVLQASGVSGVVGRLPTGAETREFTDNTGRPTDVIDIAGDSPNRTFIGTTASIHRVLPSSFLGGDTGLQLDKVSDYGVTSNFVSDSTYTVAALDDRILVLRYYEEASGYTVDIINQETRLQDIDTAVSLVGKHRLALFHKQGTNVVYCMSVGSDRRFKGFSVLVFPVAFTKIRAISSDVVGCQVVDGTYAELDFRADENTVYTDSVNNRETSFESRVATLPLLVVEKKLSSPDYVVTPRNLTLALNGFMDFTIGVVDDDNGHVETTHIREADKENIDRVRNFSGLYTHKGLGQTGSTSPRIRISKDDDKYLSISSMILSVDQG